MFSIKKVSVVLATSLALSVAPAAMAAPPSCSVGSIVRTSWCAFEGDGTEGAYSATGQSWAIYHYEPGTDPEGNPIDVRVDDVTSDPDALVVNDAGVRLWNAGVVYILEVTNGIARASN